MKKPTTALEIALLAAVLALPSLSLADGVPEPGLVMYGIVRNTADSNARVTSGTLSWTFTTASSAVTVIVPLKNIAGQLSYRVRVPFESLVGSATASGSALLLVPASTSYSRSQVAINGAAATLAAPALSTFSFSSLVRGAVERVDLNVALTGLSDPYAQWAMPIFGRSDNRDEDPDRDGLTNYQEFLAGTAPNDANSQFTFKRIYRMPDGVTVLEWDSVANRSYLVLQSTVLTGGLNSYSVVRSNILATPPLNQVAVTNGAELALFYRLMLEL